MNFNQPFVLIRKQESNNILYATGDILKIETISEITSKHSNKEKSEKENNITIDTISILPFSQIKEKGYKVIDNNEKILTMTVNYQENITIESFNTLTKDFSTSEIELEKTIEYLLNENEYGDIIQNIIDNEIGNGEGANFVIPRVGKAKIKDFTVEKILSLYKKVIENESGAYWTFLFHDGEKYFIGASPERNVFVKDNKVKMNPISGTYRKKYDSVLDLEKYKKEFIDFLENKKEVNELFMVLDEELKMMSRICSNGGMIIGPLLKEMKKLIHTEYLLSGKTSLSIREVLKESMHAPTVTGSPIENACNIICKYENDSRGYYSSNIALIGRENGEEFLDSCITIRTLEIDKYGNIIFKAGGTLVRDSNVEDEIKETQYKISGMLDILTGEKTNYLSLLDYYKNDDDIAEILQVRNQNLSKFWFFDHEGKNNQKPFLNKNAILIHNEDDFIFMIAHMLKSLGFIVQIINYKNYKFNKEDNIDLVIVGPGPGNPMDKNNNKMQKNIEIINDLIKEKQPFLAICLGHQLLCKTLNLLLDKKNIPLQGVQEEINFFNRNYKVGFYNTFTAKFSQNLKDIDISYNKDTNEVYGLKSDFFQSYQFHIESILTQDGYSILENSLKEIIR
jgi:phenazine biosynthesis protein phzE